MEIEVYPYNFTFKVLKDRRCKMPRKMKQIRCLCEYKIKYITNPLPDWTLCSASSALLIVSFMSVFAAGLIEFHTEGLQLGE